MTDADGVPGYLARDTVALLTPIANGKVLAAICALNGAKCDVLEVPLGTFAILQDEAEGVADRAAVAVSTFAKDAVLLTMERRDGHLTIVRWTGGVRGDQLPPGLALDRAPESITSIMMGTATIEDVLAAEPEKVHSGRMSRWRAFWRLRRLAAQGRREQRP